MEEANVTRRAKKIENLMNHAELNFPTIYGVLPEKMKRSGFKTEKDLRLYNAVKARIDRGLPEFERLYEEFQDNYRSNGEKKAAFLEHFNSSNRKKQAMGENMYRTRESQAHAIEFLRLLRAERDKCEPRSSASKRATYRTEALGVQPHLNDNFRIHMKLMESLNFCSLLDINSTDFPSYGTGAKVQQTEVETMLFELFHNLRQQGSIAIAQHVKNAMDTFSNLEWSPASTGIFLRLTRAFHYDLRAPDDTLSVYRRARFQRGECIFVECE